MQTDVQAKSNTAPAAFENSEVVKEIMRRMPDNIRDRGLAYRDALTKIYWSVGDWVNECVAWAFAEGLTTNKDLVCAACSSLLGNELSADTLDNYSLVASRFSNKATRQRFEVFPFSHVKYFGKFGAKDRAEVVNFDFKAMDERGGVPASLRELRQEFEPHRSSQVYRETIASVEITESEMNEAQSQIEEHLSALEGLLDRAALKDASTAVIIAKAVALIHAAQTRVLGWKK